MIAPGDISRLLGRGGGKGVVVAKVGRLGGGGGQWCWHGALTHLTKSVKNITQPSLYESVIKLILSHHSHPTGGTAGAAFRCKGGGRSSACARLAPLAS